MVVRLRIDEAGTLETVGGAREELARRSGTWVLAESNPELLVAFRDEGDADPPGRIAFCGDLAGLPFPDLVALVDQGRRTGLLRVVGRGGVRRSLRFVDGWVRGAHSTAACESLLELGLRLGLLPRPDEAAIDELSEATRDTLLQEHIVAVFEAILVEGSGAFVFEELPAQQELRPGPALPSQGLLLDGLRRADEMAHYRTRIPEGTARLARIGDAASDEPLERELLALLSSGEYTVNELAVRSRRPEMEIVRAAFHLVEAGRARVIAER